MTFLRHAGNEFTIALWRTERILRLLVRMVSVNASGITGSSIVIDYSNVTSRDPRAVRQVMLVIWATVNSTAVRCEMTILDAA